MGEPRTDDLADLRELSLAEIDAIRLAAIRRRTRGGPLGEGQPDRALYVNGRKAFIAALDHLLAQRRSIQRIYSAMEEAMLLDPMSFLVDVVMPMTPRLYRESHDPVTAGSEQEIKEEATAVAKSGPRVVLRVPDNGRVRQVPVVTSSPVAPKEATSE